MKLIAALLALLLVTPQSQDEPQEGLKEVEQALKKTPDDPMLHYRKCQELFKAGKEQKAITHAAVAMDKFKLAKQKLAWMGIGSFKTGDYRVEVIYNMGPKERAEKRDGIVRPYSFRVWTLDDDPELVRQLDFELGYVNGKPLTAAIGAMTADGHDNFGIVDTKSDFAAIKKKILEMLSK